MGETDLRVIGCKNWPQPQHMSCCDGTDPDSGICSSGLWCLLRPPFGCAICRAKLVVFRCYLKRPTGVLVSEPSQRGSHTNQGQSLHVICLGLPGKSYKVIHGWLPPVLGLELHGKGQALNPGDCHQYQAWSSSAKGQGHPKACLCPLASDRA